MRARIRRTVSMLLAVSAPIACAALARADEAPVPPEPAVSTPSDPALGSDSLSRRFAGLYHSDAYPQDVCTISAPGAAILRIRTLRFMSIGFFDGRQFTGVVRAGDTTVVRTPTGAPAWLRMVPISSDSVALTRWIGPSPTDVAREVWTRTDRTATSKDEGGGARVDKPPEAIVKGQPAYPDSARRAGIEGTVLLQALVDADGLVKDVRVIKSIPALDSAAIEAVKHWRFKPAIAEGKPVEVRVAVPITFRLK